MATKTDDDSKLNPGQSAADDKFNDIANNYDKSADSDQENVNIDKAKELLGKEGDAAGGGALNNGTDDASQAARDAEQNPSAPPTDSGFVNNFTGKGRKEGRFGSFLKGKGPAIALGSSIGGGGIALLLLLVPALLFFHLLANLFDTYDPSATALTQITKMVLLNKMGANDATTGVCRTVSVVCRFKTPSNALLRQLNDNGIVALDANKQPINLNENGKWPKTRPSFYQVSSFYSSTGDALTISPGQIKGTLQTNAGFNTAFNKAVKKLGNRAFSRLSPSLLAVMDKFRFTIRDSLGLRTSTADSPKKTIGQFLTDSLKLKASTGQAIDDVTGVIKAISDNTKFQVNRLLTYLARASKGSGIVLAMAIQCIVSEIPGMVKKVMVTMQETSMVNAGTPFITAMSATEAGDGDPETMSDVGTALQEKDSNGQAAVDSIGIRYANYGDTDVSSDPTYENVTPAAFGSLLSNLTLTDAIISNPVSDAFCGALMNPAGGAAIATVVNVAVSGGSGPAFPVVFGINLALGLGITAIIDQFGEGIGEEIGNSVAPGLAEIAQSSIDKMNAPGATRGNVIAGALSKVSTHKGAVTFGTAMTTDDLPLLSKLKQEQDAIDAEIARSTLSPLDATSRYTFLGSMVNQLLPYYSTLSSVQGTLSVAGSLLPISLSSLLSSSTTKAADPMAKYINAYPNSAELQTDSGETLAANIFGDGVYGIVPPSNWNPSETAQWLVDNEQIDEETGDAIIADSVLSETVDSFTDFADQLDLGYGDWFDICSDPSNAAQCTNDDPTKAKYALYSAANEVNSMIEDSYQTVDDADATVYDWGLDDRSAQTVDDSSKAEALTGVFAFASLAHDLFRSYGGSLFASSSASVTDTLARFTLWR